MTVIVELYGGPGCGKSTIAAETFTMLKRFDINAELVVEYAKEWAWLETPIRDFDQLHFFGEQLKREARLFDKVDIVITDSPVLLCGFYMRKYGLEAMHEYTDMMMHTYYRMARLHDHQHIPILLNRTKQYNPKGRYESEEVAKQYDQEIKVYVESMLNIKLKSLQTAHDVLRVLIAHDALMIPATLNTLHE